MAKKIKARVAASAQAAAPWRRGVPWWLVLIEGAVMLALGFYMFVAPVKTRILLAIIIAAALGISGAVQLIAIWRSKDRDSKAPASTVATWSMIRGAVGLATGVLILLLLLLNSGAVDLGRAILGIGALAYGAIGLYILYLVKEKGARLAAIVNCIFFIVVGAIMLFDLLGGSVYAALGTLINIFLLLVGAFLIVWSLVLRNNGQKATVA